MKPALVVSCHITGLGAIRALGTRKIPIVAAYYRDTDMGYLSRYVIEAASIPHPIHHEKEFIEALRTLIDRFPGCLLLPADDESVVAISKYRKHLEPHAVVSCPPWDTVERIVEKKFTYKLAEDHSIPIPRTWYPHSFENVKEYADEILFPCIIKPSQSHLYYCTFNKKLAFVKDRKELFEEYREAVAHGIEVMIQEYIPGGESSSVNYCVYGSEGQALTEFTAVKIRQSPPYFGVPCVVKSKMLHEVMAVGRQVLRVLHYTGYACIEFKRDDRDGMYKIMDINGRVNLSVLHAVKCGINFPWLTYKHLMLGELPSKDSFRENVYWIDFVKDAIQDVKLHRAERRNIRKTLTPYWKSHGWAVIDRTDMKPFIKRCSNFFVRFFNSFIPTYLPFLRDNSHKQGTKSHSHTKTIYIEGDACNRRLLERSKIEEYLISNGYTFIKKPGKADYILVITCAFKKQEEEESIARLRRLRKYRAKLLVYGCLPEIAPKRWKEFHGIDFLLPKDLDKIDSFFDDIERPYSKTPDPNEIRYYHNASKIRVFLDKISTNDVLSKEFFFRAIRAVRRRAHSFIDASIRDYYLFICRGCQGKCTYCAIRRSVGNVVSKPIDIVREEFRTGLERGYRNFHILGDDPGCYGLDINSSMSELLSTLLTDLREKNQNETKLHIKEIHPKHLVNEGHNLVSILGEKEISSILCPIQSGNNRILDLMQREHTAEEMNEVFSSIKRENPKVELSTQIIVGFPSETENEFQETLRYVEQLKFDSVVVFPYHDKENTPASSFDHKLSESEIEMRARRAIRHFRKRGIKAYSRCPPS